jgi:carboxyl-terminal processing protease
MAREVIRATSVYYDMLEGDIGYIRIASFDGDTDKEFAAARLSLLSRGMRALVIDLRDNGGGLMASALSIADQLVPFSGHIAHYERQGTILESVPSTVNHTKQVPLAVLVNEYTASASECLAGALQDNGVARVIGRTTYGKGVAQTLSESPDGGAYKLSVYYFLTPDKKRIDGAGIAPDQVVYESGGLSRDEAAAILRVLAPMSEKNRYYAGQAGLNVYGAQQRLRHLGYDAPLTGTMDAATVGTIKKFQSDEKLYPYGGLDYTTMDAIARAFEVYVQGDGEDRQLQAAIDWLTK